MKKAILKANSRRGFIRNIIAPVNDREDPGFGVWDTLEVVFLISALLLVGRFLLAH